MMFFNLAHFISFHFLFFPVELELDDDSEPLGDELADETTAEDIVSLHEDDEEEEPELLLLSTK